MTKTERLEKEFGKASAALDKAEEKAKEARADVLRAIEESEGIDASRRREEAAKAAVITARREASDVAEVLRKARDEEETARRDAELADLRRRAESLAAEAEAGLKAGTKAVAEGLIVVGKAMVAAAGSEDAGDALRRVKAPPAGGARFHALHVEDAIATALGAAYTGTDRGAWTEEFSVRLHPLLCVERK